MFTQSGFGSQVERLIPVLATRLIAFLVCLNLRKFSFYITDTENNVVT